MGSMTTRFPVPSRLLKGRREGTGNGNNRTCPKRYKTGKSGTVADRAECVTYSPTGRISFCPGGVQVSEAKPAGTVRVVKLYWSQVSNFLFHIAKCNTEL